MSLADKMGETPLHKAAAAGHLPAASSLLAAGARLGADVDARSSPELQTALYQACSHRR